MPCGRWGRSSFAESSFFPVPPDVMLIPMSLARPERAYVYRALVHIDVGVRRLARLADRRVALRFGRALADPLYGYGDKVEAFRAAYAQWGAWIILLKGLTPIPYKIVTITSGFAGYNLGLFILSFDHHPRHALLPPRVPAPPLWRAGPRTSSKSGSGFWVAIGAAVLVIGIVAALYFV